MKINSGLLFLFLLITSTHYAQLPGMMEPLPFDVTVRKGKLPNGMTYYIKKNQKPENRAELRIALNAGSTAEDDNQQGLAHFCEHMAFNGTKNFKKNELISYLESVGTKFGAHLNAYTSFDETVYMIQIPTDVDSILNKGLQIMEDWAHDVSYDSLEIDKERGVVVEEWRLGLGAQDRMRKKYWPVLFKDSRYADRLPIGKKEILEKCAYDDLRSFYADWYRPDLMAIIAVGDFDPEKMERKIIAQFGSIPAKENPRPIKSWNIPDNKELLSAVATDKEAQYTLVQLMYKQPRQITSNIVEYRRLLLEELYNGMINQRLQEMQKQENPPFTFASCGYSTQLRNTDAYTCVAAVKPGGIEKGLSALVIENERVKKFGFTRTEFVRQKKELLREMEKKYNERDKTESAGFARDYVQHFLRAEPSPGISYEYALYRELLPGIQIEEINVLAGKWVTEGENAVVIIMGPDKEGLVYPNDERIKQIMQEARVKPIQPYRDNMSTKPLLAIQPAGSKVISETEIKELNITVWTLENGARVLLKPTDYKNDELLFNAEGFGGTSLVEDKDFISAAYAAGIISESGIGEFNQTVLEKMLQGKIVEITPEIADITQSLSGSCSPQDLETMMQLIYLYFTAPRKDEVAFKSVKEQLSAFLQNRENSPERIYFDTITYTMSGFDHRYRPTRLDMLEEINLDRAIEIYKERFADASGFTFTFVGNIRPEILKPMVEKYIGGLPALNKKETFKNRKKKVPKGNLSVTVRKGTEPKSTVGLKFTGPFEFTRKHRFEVNALLKLLGIKLRENLREEKSGVYGVGAVVSFKHYPVSQYEISVGFGCAPENVEDLIKAAIAEIDDVKKNGCSEINLTKIKETFLRERESYLKENVFWLNSIAQNEINKENLLEILDYNKWVNSLTSEELKNLAVKYFNMEEYKRFVLLPEK